MNWRDKLWIVLTNAVLYAVGTVVLLWLATLAGCAKAPQAHTVNHPEALAHVYLPNSVPGWWTFCVEDPLLAWPSEPQVIRRSTGWVCGLTVNEVRQWIAQQRRAD